MAFCGKCGTQVQDGKAFCPSCGAQLAAQQQRPAEPAQAGQPTPAERRQRQRPPEDQADIQQNKGMAILAYIGPLVFVPMFAAKDSRFCRFHSNQGLVLFILEAAFSILLGILTAVAWRVFWLWTILWMGGWAFLTVLLVLGIVNASKGVRKRLPVIGGIQILR